MMKKGLETMVLNTIVMILSRLLHEVSLMIYYGVNLILSGETQGYILRINLYNYEKVMKFVFVNVRYMTP